MLGEERVKKSKNVIITLIGILMLFLSACGSSESTANRILKAVKEKDYRTAKEIYEKEVDKAADKKEFNDVVSIPLQDYINESFDEIDIDIDEESTEFYSLLVNIERVGVLQATYPKLLITIRL
jgi:predicted nucleic acid-binding protein